MKLGAGGFQGLFVVRRHLADVGLGIERHKCGEARRIAGGLRRLLQSGGVAT